VSALLALGCSSGQSGAGSGGASGGTPGSGGAAASGGSGGATAFGAVNVLMVPQDDATFTVAHGSLTARLYGAASPATPTSIQEEMAGCQLVVPQDVVCTPACDSASLCTATDQCTAKPKAQDLGTLHVTGLQTTSGGASFDVAPGSGNVYMSETLPYPPCAEGDSIVVQSGAFTVTGKCIGPLTVTSPAPLRLVDAQKNPIAAALTWSPPSQAGISRIRLILEISHHGGGSKGEVDCDVPDTGSFTIPQKLVADLIALGVAGYPTIEVSRVSAASPANAPGVQLLVSTSLLLDVDSGVLSCGGGSDPASNSCPDGTTCSDGPPYLCQ